MFLSHHKHPDDGDDKDIFLPRIPLPTEAEETEDHPTLSESSETEEEEGEFDVDDSGTTPTPSNPLIDPVHPDLPLVLPFTKTSDIPERPDAAQVVFELPRSHRTDPGPEPLTQPPYECSASLLHQVPPDTDPILPRPLSSIDKTTLKIVHRTGSSCGVSGPIRICFNVPILEADRPAVVRSISVSLPSGGGDCVTDPDEWTWVSSQVLRLRTSTGWDPEVKYTVTFAGGVDVQYGEDAEKRIPFMRDVKWDFQAEEDGELDMWHVRPTNWLNPKKPLMFVRYGQSIDPVRLNRKHVILVCRGDDTSVSLRIRLVEEEEVARYMCDDEEFRIQREACGDWLDFRNAFREFSTCIWFTLEPQDLPEPGVKEKYQFWIGPGESRSHREVETYGPMLLHGDPHQRCPARAGCKYSNSIGASFTNPFHRFGSLSSPSEVLLEPETAPSIVYEMQWVDQEDGGSVRRWVARALDRFHRDRCGIRLQGELVAGTAYQILLKDVRDCFGQVLGEVKRTYEVHK